MRYATTIMAVCFVSAILVQSAVIYMGGDEAREKRAEINEKYNIGEYYDELDDNGLSPSGHSRIFPGSIDAPYSGGQGTDLPPRDDVPPSDASAGTARTHASFRCRRGGKRIPDPAGRPGPCGGGPKGPRPARGPRRIVRKRFAPPRGRRRR